jgi:prepilin-type N-terminal cleavage/methylation domain-containing protein
MKNCMNINSFSRYSGSSSSARTNGFTLLEILLTTAVLLIGLTAVFQTTRSALQTMAKARELTEAQNACQAVLNELLAQSSPIQPDAERTIEHLPHWRIRIDIYPAPQSGLYVLHLSAQQFSPTDDTLLGVKYQILRWVPAERVHLPDASETFVGDEFDDLFL